MKTIEILDLCEKRGGIDFLYKIAKIIAETDSIGEGYSYCHSYKKSSFRQELKELKQGRDYGYVNVALDIYDIIVNGGVL